MTRGTRYFLTGSALVVTIGLGTGLVAYYNGGLPLGLTRAGNADLGYLPGDAGAVAFADVRAIMGSEFRQKLRQVLPTGEELNKFRDELGVDIERDIDTVAAAYLGGVPAMGSGVVVVRGRFDEGRIEALATQHGAIASDYKGKRILTMTAPERPEGMVGDMAAHHPTGAVAFLEPGVLALGDSAAIQRAIDAGASGDEMRKNTELIALIDDVRGTGNAWFVGRFDAMTNHPGMPTEVRDHMPAVNLFAVSVHVNGGVSGMLRAEARDDKAAEQLRDVVRGGLAAGRLVTGQNPKVDAMLNSLQVTGTGKTVSLSFSVPPELLDVLNGVAAAHQLGTGSSAPIKK
jgi:hypothetical protein